MGGGGSQVASHGIVVPRVAFGFPLVLLLEVGGGSVAFSGREVMGNDCCVPPLLGFGCFVLGLLLVGLG